MNEPPSLKTAFQPNLLVLPVDRIVQLKEVPSTLRRTTKYKQIAASLQHVGVIEPIVVFPAGDDRYWLLDGHLRLDVLIQNKVTEVKCLLATEDESYNYNKRVNSLPAIAEHQMILKAINHGVPEQRIAEALNVDVAKIRQKRSLLDGVCSEATDLLKDKRITAQALATLRKMKPVRQVEAAELMIASNSFSLSFAKALLSVTRTEFLAEPLNEGKPRRISAEQSAIMEEETKTLLKDLRAAEESYGTDILNLTVARRYVEGLLRNRRVRKFLFNQHGDILNEMEQLLSELEAERSKRKEQIYGVKLTPTRSHQRSRKAG